MNSSANHPFQRVALILNPIKPERPEQLKKQVAAGVAAIPGAELKIWETSVAEPGTKQAREALDWGAELVIAAGGDGTVRAVATALAYTDCALALMPCGTGNLLARNLGLSINNTKSCLNVALSGHVDAIDMAYLQWGNTIEELEAASKELFLVIAGFGYDAAIMADTDSDLKKWVGWLAYVVAGVKNITGRNQNVWIRLDQKKAFMRPARTVMVGNVGRLPAGVNLMPDATPTSANLSMLVASWRGLAGLSQVITRVVAQKRQLFTRISGLELLQAKRVQVWAPHSFPIEADGDHHGKAHFMAAEVAAGALKVMTPGK